MCQLIFLYTPLDIFKHFFVVWPNVVFNELIRLTLNPQVDQLCIKISMLSLTEGGPSGTLFEKHGQVALIRSYSIAVLDDFCVFNVIKLKADNGANQEKVFDFIAHLLERGELPYLRHIVKKRECLFCRTNICFSIFRFWRPQLISSFHFTIGFGGRFDNILVSLILEFFDEILINVRYFSEPFLGNFSVFGYDLSPNTFMNLELEFFLMSDDSTFFHLLLD